MATGIQWTDETWNPVTGCSKVSPGCAHCYAETVALRFWPTQYIHTVERGFISAREYRGDRMDGKLRQFTDVMCHEDRLDQPLRWRTPRKVFVNSMSDLFHEDVPDAFIDRVFAVMALTPWHIYQVLTKRAERMRNYCTALTFQRLLPWMNDFAPDGAPLKRQTPAGGFVPTGAENLTTLARRAKLRAYRFSPLDMPMRTPPPPFPHVWLGVSVENQHFADERIPLLLQTPAAVRFISAEPLLGPVDLRCLTIRHRNTIDALRGWHDNEYPDQPRQHIPALDWVIVGGESGPGARPFDVAWGRSIVQQCQAAGVPVFVKQLGGYPVQFTPGAIRLSTPPITGALCRVPEIKNKKGGDWSEWPEDLRVRQFPEVAHAR